MARRRGGRTGLVALVVLVLVVGLVGLGLVTGDRYARQRVEREAASRLQTELGTPDPPSVHVEGWPFLTQVAARHLKTVHVVADDLHPPGSAVPVAHADLVLHDVTSGDWFQTMTAASADGTARLDHAALATATGLPLRYAGDGRVRVDQQVSRFGVDVTASVTGRLALDAADQTVTLADPELRVGDVAVPAAAAATILPAVLRPVPVTGLPFGLRLTSLDVRDDGVHAGLAGTDLRLR